MFNDKGEKVMKKIYEIPSVEMTQMKGNAILLVSPPSGIEYSVAPGTGVTGD